MLAVTNNKRSISAIAHLMKTDADLAAFLKEGDLVEAYLLKRAPRQAYFDLGRFGTGIVYGTEFLGAKQIIKELKEGDRVAAKVVDAENEDGFVELSLAGAHRQKNWQEIKELKESSEAVTVRMIGANSGGLVAELHNIKAFLPVSQLAVDHYPRVVDADKAKIFEELKKLVGEELKVKIIDFNPRNNKLIISEREAVEENVRELISANYKVGDVVDGIVSGVADFGIFVRFVDNPAIEGLIHISELDHRLIDSPKEIAKIDDAVKVKIIEIKERQVFLSLKALKENPWDHAAEKFKEGDEVEGGVYKFNPFGAYINLPHALQGLIHVSDFGSIDEMKKALEQGKSYAFIVCAVKPEEKRILLKLKR